MAQFNLETLVREFLTNKKIVGLVKLVKPLDLVKSLVNDVGLCASDAASVTLDLIKNSDPVKFEQLVHEGIPLGSMSNGKFPVPNKLKRKKDSLEEISPLRGEPEFDRNVFPPEHHRSLPKQFPYDDQTVRWSRVRGNTPKAGHQN